MPSYNFEELLAKAEREGGGGDYVPAPPGEYNFVIAEATAGRTKDGTKDIIKAKAKILDEGEAKGKVVWQNFTISPESGQALEIFFNQFKLLGLTAENFWSKSPTPEQMAAALVGRPFRAKIKLKTYNGKESNEIDRFYSANESGREAAAAFMSGAPSDAPAPSSAPADAPPPTPQATAPAPPSPEPVAAPAGATPPVPPPPPRPSF